jgi:WD40 repeat protein
MRLVSCCGLLVVIAGAVTAAPPVSLREPTAVYSLAPPAGSDNGVYTSGLSPDGKLVACVGGGRLSVFEVGKTAALFTSKPGSVGTNHVTFSADGKLVSFAGSDGRIRVLSARPGAAVASLALPGDNPGAVQALELSPDGRQLAVSCGHLYHMDLHLFGVATGKLLGTPWRTWAAWPTSSFTRPTASGWWPTSG